MSHVSDHVDFRQKFSQFISTKTTRVVREILHCSLKNVFIYIVVYVKAYPEGKGYFVSKRNKSMPTNSNPREFLNL